MVANVIDCGFVHQAAKTVAKAPEERDCTFVPPRPAQSQAPAPTKAPATTPSNKAPHDGR